jgi:Mycobacterium 19 kDa lipoprotein antigen
VGGRFVTTAVTVLVVVASCAGCFMRSDKVAQKTARITVDNNTRTSHAVTCNQVQWLLTANITAAPATVQVKLKLDSDKPKLESVNFNNFAGFNGVADAGAGDAKAVFANGTYTITGTAEGSQLNDPRVSLTAPFKIEVGC